MLALMKRYFIFSLLFAWGITLQAQTFEGVISIQSSSEEGLNATYYLKGTKVYVEHKMPSGMRYYLLDTRTNKKTLLVKEEGENLAVMMPKDRLLQAKSSELKESTREVHQIELVPEEREIFGLSCRRADGANQEVEGIVWLTKAAPFGLRQLVPAISVRFRPWLTDFGAFGVPLEWWQRDRRTGEEWTTVLTYEEKTLDQAMFRIPADFETIDLGDMRQLMKANEEYPDKMPEIKQWMQEMEDLD